MKHVKLQEQDEKLLKEAFDNLFVNDLKSSLINKDNKNKEILENLNDSISALKSEMSDLYLKSNKTDNRNKEILENLNDSISVLKSEMSDLNLKFNKIDEKNNLNIDQTLEAFNKIQVKIDNTNNSINNNEELKNELYKTKEQIDNVSNNLGISNNKIQVFDNLNKSLKSIKITVFVLVIISIIILLELIFIK